MEDVKYRIFNQIENLISGKIDINKRTDEREKRNELGATFIQGKGRPVY